MAGTSYTQGPDINIPTDLLYSKFMLDSLQKNGSQIALIDGITDKRYSYSELRTLVLKCATSLEKRGITEGDHVWMFSDNCVEYVIVFIACTCVGAVFVTPEWRSAMSGVFGTLKHIMTSIPPKMAFVSPTLLNGFETIGKELHLAFALVVLGEMDGYLSFENFIAVNEVKYCHNSSLDSKTSVCSIVFTSGTTGKPKAVMHSHYSLLATALSSCDAIRMRPMKEILVVNSPMFHTYARHIIVAVAIVAGATIVLLPTGCPKQVFLRSLEIYKASVIMTFSIFLEMLTYDPIVDEYNLSAIRDLITSAGCITSTCEEDAKQRLGLPNIRQLYGFTEMQTVLMTPYGKSCGESSGEVIAGVECKVVDVKGRNILPRSIRGEVCFRSQSTMVGYLGMEEKTRETIDSERWVLSGDYGFMDNEGRVYIRNRLQDIIHANHGDIVPHDVEAVLMSNPAVNDVGVIGIEFNGDVIIRAYVELKRNVSATEHELLLYMNERLHQDDRPPDGAVRIVDKIPRMSNGKLVRNELKQMAKNN